MASHPSVDAAQALLVPGCDVEEIAFRVAGPLVHDLEQFSGSRVGGRFGLVVPVLGQECD